MKFLILLLPLVAWADEGTYQVNGLYAGMSASAAKAAGLTVCNDEGLETITCRPKTQPAPFLTLPITRLAVYFKKPYDKVDRVVFDVDYLKSKTKDCQPEKAGPLRGIVAASCITSADEVVTAAYGPSVDVHLWHKCDLDTLEIKDHTITLWRAPPPHKDMRISQCAQATALKASSAKAQSERDAFIKIMK